MLLLIGHIAHAGLILLGSGASEAAGLHSDRRRSLGSVRHFDNCSVYQQPPGTSVPNPSIRHANIKYLLIHNVAVQSTLIHLIRGTVSILDAPQ